MDEVKRKKVEELKNSGVEPFKCDFKRSHTIAEVRSRAESLMANGEVVDLTGRVMLIRRHGKASFLVIEEFLDKIQVYFKYDLLGGERYEFFKKFLDIGDIIWVKGKVFRTRTGELTIAAEEFELVVKSLRTLPEKFHGLKDPELRYRKRYLDLIANPEVRERFVLRSRILREIRSFLYEREFVEVETPVLHPVAGGANAKPFITHYNALDSDFYLRIALELHLKRMLVAGWPKVFEIGKVFRNEGISHEHSPEYTLHELYWGYANYEDVMELLEEMVRRVVKECLGGRVVYGEHELDFLSPWRRVRFFDLLSEKAGEDLSEFSFEELVKFGEKVGVEKVEKAVSRGKALEILFSELVEPTLVQPTFVLDYPVEISPLAARKRGAPELVYRFEAFAGGIEFANAFTELNDPLDQRERFEAQRKEREMGEKESHPYDEDFLEALEYGMMPAGGLGVGVDRLLMLLLGVPNIREVILFPQLKRKWNEE